MKKILGIILGTIVIVGGIYYYQNRSKAPEQNNQPDEVQNTPQVKTYTMEEVAKHGAEPLDENADANSFSCWTVIRDKVYDITDFLDSHPGGEAIYQACGRDATTLFETRPEGSGTPHSANARAILEKYYIGDLRK